MAEPVITLEQPALARAIGRVTHIAERRSEIQILGNLRLVLREGGLEITGTDLDIEARALVPCDAGAATIGAGTTVPAQRLADIVKRLPGGAPVTLAWDGTVATIRSGRARLTLPTLPAEDFPDLSAREPTHQFCLPAADLARAIECTAFAMSDDETRYYLCGLYLHGALGPDGSARLRAVATTGAILSRLEMPAPAGAEGLPGAVVPRKTVHALARLVGERGAADARIALSEATIRVTVGDITLTSKLIDCTYPDYERVIPTRNPFTATADREALLAAAQRVTAVVDRAAHRDPAVTLSPAADRVAVSAGREGDAAAAVDEVPAAYDGDPLTICFSHALFSAGIGAFSGETVKLWLASPGEAALVTGDGVDDAGLQVVIMPRRAA